MQEYIPQILTKEKMLEKAKLLPRLPGVYLFFDKSGTILYVGKSKALHNRVLSYLQNIGKHPPKTEKLVSQAVDFQTIVTETEAEALILENEKIKLHQPKFNIRLKDDKNYPYIRLSLGESYPRLSFARRRESKKKEKSKYFGPYSSAGAVHTIIDLANKIFALPTCKRSFPREIGREKPCLYFHLNRCCGVCTGAVSEEEYAKKIDEVIAFLKSDYTRVSKNLTAQMEEAAENLDFERAAKLRDHIRALSRLSENRQIVKDLSFDADVFGLYADDLGGAVNQLSVREGRVVDSIHFHFGADEIVSAENFSSFLLELYRGRDFLPRQIMLPPELFGEDVELLSEILQEKRGASVKIVCPERGNGKKIVALAAENAREASLHRRAMLEKDEEVLVELASLLQLEVLPERIESIDISGSGNDFLTASIITVQNAHFSKRDYKSFHLSLTQQDDYASMYEAISRRVRRFREGDAAFQPLPDLFLVDGGVGQVSAVRRALADQGVFVPVIGMVKDSFHKTRALTDGENEFSIAKNARLFQFIYRIQEEVHRFTLSRMDIRRRKSVKTTSLSGIPGIGEKKAALLLKQFRTVKAIREADVEALSAVKGISRKNAEEIVRYFGEKEKQQNSQ